MRASSFAVLLPLVPSVAVAQAAQQIMDTLPPGPKNVRDAAAVLAIAPRVRIGNDLLKVTVLLPAKGNSFYRGVRFDNSGMISSVRYRNQEFYGLWFDKLAGNVRDFLFDNGEVVAGVNTGALGPAEVYDPENPPGWTEAPAGGAFLKIGVGMLRKPSSGGTYSQFGAYQPASLGVWKITSKRDRVEFTHTIKDTESGYGYIYRKVVRVVSDKPVLRIEHSLTNTGTRSFSTTAYNHNFMTYGGQAPTSQGLTVSTRYGIVAGPLADVAQIIGNKLIYKRALIGEQRFSSVIGGFSSGAGPYDISVHNASGAGFQVVGDVPMSRMVLWSIRRTIAAEPYVSLRVDPAKTVNWSFEYTYTASADASR